MEGDVVIEKSANSGLIVNESERVLEPYIHQVGGRSLILNYDRCTLCKPMIPQERQFYEDLPGELQLFTPRYKGVINVGYRTSADGHIQLIAYPSTANGLKVQDVNFNNGYSVNGVAQATGGSIGEEQESDEELAGRVEQDSIFLAGSLSKSDKGAMNPWTLHCQYLHVQHLHKAWQGNHQLQEFILMENIACDLTCPCIMDLKMGDKRHSDYCSGEEKERQKAKFYASTSASLGVRIAGAQVYKCATGKYTYRNKYYGFELTRNGFKDELCQFVHDGHRIRTEVIPAFIEKLKKLHACVKSLDGSRFYSSSLLLIYDGQEPGREQKEQGLSSLDKLYPVTGTSSEGCSVDIRMIDFSRSFHSTDKDPEASGPDKGYLLGIESLIKVFQEILQECNK